MGRAGVLLASTVSVSGEWSHHGVGVLLASTTVSGESHHGAGVLLASTVSGESHHGAGVLVGEQCVTGHWVDRGRSGQDLGPSVCFPSVSPSVSGWIAVGRVRIYQVLLRPAAWVLSYGYTDILQQMTPMTPLEIGSLLTSGSTHEDPKLGCPHQKRLKKYQ